MTFAAVSAIEPHSSGRAQEVRVFFMTGLHLFARFSPETPPEAFLTGRQLLLERAART